MQISNTTLLSLVTASGVVFCCARYPMASTVLMAMVLPFSIMALALTCPKDHTHLNPKGMWALAFLCKTWLFSVLFVALFCVLTILSPYWSNRVLRAFNGDLAPYRFSVSFFASQEALQQLIATESRLRDKWGELGTVKEFSSWERPLRRGGDEVVRVSAKVSGNRRPSKVMGSYEIEIRGSNLFLDYE